MRAAEMKERPDFALMRQTDIQTVYHMQMPRWLFSDPRYADMSLDAKVAYTFLLNRFQLSRRNGWVNDRGEVFVIFPRKELAAELRICEQRVTAAFRKLTELKLIWEKRCGRGDANQIYLATVTPQENADYECAPFVSGNDGGSKNADSAGLDDAEPAAPAEEAPDSCAKSRENGASRAANLEAPEPPKMPPSYTYRSQTETSSMEDSRSVPPTPTDEAAEENELEEILESCELECFPPETARVFENAVERLFYADSFRIGGATLPQKRVRAKLCLLDGMILREAERKLHANLDREVKNSTAYVMATVFNSISEYEGDLLVDPYLNRLRAPPEGGDAGCC